MGVHLYVFAGARAPQCWSSSSRKCFRTPNKILMHSRTLQHEGSHIHLNEAHPTAAQLYVEDRRTSNSSRGIFFGSTGTPFGSRRRTLQLTLHPAVPGGMPAAPRGTVYRTHHSGVQSAPCSPIGRILQCQAHRLAQGAHPAGV